MSEKTSFFRIKVQSPLHIGCNEVYEPTSFVIDENAVELISFDTPSLLEKLDDKALRKFSTICAKGTIESLLELYKFIRSQLALAEGEHVPVAPPLVEHYRSTMELPLNHKRIQQELNNFVINRTAFNPLMNIVYIPGSTIKGAVRTAILNLRHNEHPISRKPYEKMKPRELSNESRILQKRILGGAFHTDPLRIVKVSDFMPVGEVKKRIIYAVDRKKNPGPKEATAPYQILEVIESGTEFVGTISVETPLNAPEKKDNIQQPVTMAEIENALMFFFGAEKKREDKEVKIIGSEPVVIEYGNSAWPLRIGRHSGAECVTVNGHRSIKVSPPGKKPDKYEKRATTLWLAANSKKPTSGKYLRSLGWILLEKLPQDTWASLKSQVDLFQKEALGKDIYKGRAERIHAQEEERLRRQEEKQAAEEEKRKEEEALRKKDAALAARWDAMDEMERDLAVLRGEKFATTRIKGDLEQYINTQIWPKVDKLEGVEQKTLASTFKNYFKEKNKWKVRKKTKQFKKVSNVKMILGEI